MQYSFLLFLLISTIYSWYFHESCRDITLPYVKVVSMDIYDIIYFIRIPIMQCDISYSQCLWINLGCQIITEKNESTIEKFYSSGYLDARCNQIKCLVGIHHYNGYCCEHMTVIVYNSDRNVSKGIIKEYINNTIIERYNNTIIEKYNNTYIKEYVNSIINNIPLYSIGTISSITLIIVIILIVYNIYLSVIICRFNKLINPRPMKYNKLQEIEMKVSEIPSVPVYIGDY